LEATLRRLLPTVFWEEMVQVWAFQGYLVVPVPAPVEIVRSPQNVEDAEMEIAAESDSASVTDIVTDVEVESDLATSVLVFDETVHEAKCTFLSLPEVETVPSLEVMSLSFEPFEKAVQCSGLLGAPVVVYMYILLISLMKYTCILLLLAAPVLSWYCSQMWRGITSASRDVLLFAVSVLMSKRFNALRLDLGVIYWGEKTKKGKNKQRKTFWGRKSTKSQRQGPSYTISFMSAPWKVGIGRYLPFGPILKWLVTRMIELTKILSKRSSNSKMLVKQTLQHFG